MTEQRPDISTHSGEPVSVRSREDLKSTGLLWLINSSLLHPRGFALALVRKDDEIIGWMLLGDGSEPWCFKGVETGACDGNFADVEALFAEAQQPVQPRGLV